MKKLLFSSLIVLSLISSTPVIAAEEEAPQELVSIFQKILLSFKQYLASVNRSSQLGAVGTTDGLVAHYTFDDVLTDNLGGSSGVASGSPQFVEGKFGKGIKLDGNGQNISIKNNSSLEFGTGSYTVSLWYKNDTSSNGGIISKRQFYGTRVGWEINRVGTYYGFIADGGSDGGKLDFQAGSQSYGTWKHVVVVVNRQTNIIYMYVDGKLVKQAPVSGVSNVSSNSALLIGSQFDKSGFVQGTFDDVRLYNVALSPPDIQTLAGSIVTDSVTPVPQSDVVIPPKVSSTYNVSITKSGAGSGTISATGISCGGDCSESYPTGTQATLQVVTSEDSVFTGWSGGGCESSGTTCTVSVNGDKKINANFNLKVIGQLPSIINTSDVISNPSVFESDPESTNYKSGIDVKFSGKKGADYMEEYLYHDKNVDDHKIVYIRDTTQIALGHNERNLAKYPLNLGYFKVIGKNGLDGIANSGDEGIIRYKIDRDRQYLYRWSNYPGASTPLPAYSSPFTLKSQTFEPGIPVVGSTGSNGKPLTSKNQSYFRGVLDSFGDEWHVLSYGDDDKSHLSKVNGTRAEDWGSDGKTVLFVVNPKTPALTVRASGGAQFYTTPSKAYYTPKIVPQTTYFDSRDGGITFEIRDINGNNVFYKINGGVFIDTGSSAVVLDEDDFRNGENTLQYYYKGREGNVKTRVVVKNPLHPSLKEKHGHFLFSDESMIKAVKSRIQRLPYSTVYSPFKNNTNNAAQHTSSNTNTISSGRPYATNGYSTVLGNAVVAKLEGWNFKPTNSTKTHGSVAKSRVMNNIRTVDPLGFELSHGDDVHVSRELHTRGYYDARVVDEVLFAYDILVGYFRSDQVTDGISPIEDYFVRDKLAGFAYEAMQWSSDLNPAGSPHNWGGARMATAMMIGIVMPEYSTPYYGTSGFGSVQKTYPLTPFQDDQLTWKQALFDNNRTKTAYPNYTWSAEFSGNTASTMFPTVPTYFGGNLWPAYSFISKASYFSNNLNGLNLAVFQNIVKRAGLQHPYDGLNEGFLRAAKGTLIGRGDTWPGSNHRYAHIILINSFFPEIESITRTWVQSLPKTDDDSDDEAARAYGLYTLFWYDDGLSTSSGSNPLPPNPPPTPTPPPSNPDTDEDGILDSLDRCDNTPKSLKAVVNNYGCLVPKITTFDIKPSTTNLDLSSIEVLELGKTNIGKVRWTTAVPLTRTTAQLDLDTHLKIEKNKVTLNSSSLPELNRPAQITLYNITEKKPKILKDGSTCTTCTINSFSNNTLTFTVTGFSTYEVVEGEEPPVITPPTQPASTPTTGDPTPKTKSSSGGGGGSKSTSSTLTLPTNATREQLISYLIAKIQELIAEYNRVKALEGGGTTDTVLKGFQFTTTFGIGANNPQVRYLQRFLNTHGFPVGTGLGSYGKEVDTFGPVTKATLIKYQLANGIEGTGYFGQLTRSKINQVLLAE